MSDYRQPNRRWTFRGRLDTIRPTTEEITPHSGWTEEPTLHTLLVELPGFKESDIKFSIEKPGLINVSGERVRDSKRVHFKKAFNVPEDAEVDRITMEFAGDVLKVFVPRVVKDKKTEPEIKSEASASDSLQKKKQEPEMSKEEPEKPKEEPETPKEEPKKEPKIPKEEPKKPKEEPKMPKEEPEKPKEEPDKPKEEPEKPKVEPEKLKEEPQLPKKEPQKPNEEPDMPKEESEKPKELSKEDPEMPKDDPRLPKDEPEVSEEENAQKTKDKLKEDEISRVQEESNRDQGEEASPKSVIGKISEQKGILLASIISFALGFLLSKKFQHPPPK